MNLFHGSTSDISDRKIIHHLFSIMVFAAIMCSCDGSVAVANDEVNEPPASSKASLAGTVKDESGHPYPETRVRITKDGKTIIARTNVDGRFSFENIDSGIYEVIIDAPLSTKPVTGLPLSIDVQANVSSSVDIIIQPQALKAELIIGSADIFGEIRNESGNPPTGLAEPLYAQNIWDSPLGLLTAIKATDAHHVTLAEWKAAQGAVMVNCNGIASNASIGLQGMIPGGTYTFWLNFLNKIKQIGQPVNFAADVESIAPLGSGTTNILVADADGNIQAEVQHPSCMLTDSAGLVMVVVYHINGNTYGAAHIPDPEEAAQMLVYFQ